MIDSQIGKVKFGQTLKAGNKQAGLDGPCVTTYHPDFKKIRQNMEKIEHLLYQDESVKRLFTPLTMFSYCSARKLGSLLVCAKPYLLERERRSYKCGNSRCEVCYSIEEIDTLVITVTDEPFKINHHLSCNDKCFIYFLTRKVRKKQYTGKKG